LTILTEVPHRRFNPLTEEWVLVSPHRALRPWQGQVEAPVNTNRPSYDPHCHLCPRNERTSGECNPDYQGVFVFNNDFAALKSDEVPPLETTHPLFRAEVQRGICRVICYSERHDASLATMSETGIRKVVDTWADQTTSLAADNPWLKYVQVFENKGEMMGQSSPHPHGQLWASDSLPQYPGREDQTQRAYFNQRGSTMLAEILAEEQRMQQRIVFSNDHWTVLVPYWAVWPFEVMLIAHRPVAWIADLEPAERDALANALSRLSIRYDNLFQTPFPYSMGFHQAPVNSGPQPHWHLHAHYYPPLLRNASVKKHMVGYEMLANPQRDLTAEQTAQRLRELPETPYTAR
jgi:UDPglucose--hexose-1-phosphate uridylyltransferase